MGLSNHHLTKIAAKGCILVVTLDAVTPTLPYARFSPDITALNPVIPFVRLRNNLAKSEAKSINMNVDLEASDAVYTLLTKRIVYEIAFEQEEECCNKA